MTPGDFQSPFGVDDHFTVQDQGRPFVTGRVAQVKAEHVGNVGLVEKLFLEPADDLVIDHCQADGGGAAFEPL